MADIRTNKKNFGLPPRWRLTRNAYYYSVPLGQEAQWDDKKTFRLGGTLAEAHAEYGKRMMPTDVRGDASNTERLLNAYLMKQVPTYSVTWAAFCQAAIINLKKSFGAIKPINIQPILVHQYLTARSVKTTNSKGKIVGGNNAANREIEILQSALTWAVGQGMISRHPFKDMITFRPENSASRYVEDWEVDEMMKVTTNRKKGSTHVIKAYIKIKVLTGMAKGDILRLTMSDVSPEGDGIFIKRHKTQTHKGTNYLWSPELRAAVSEAVAARPCISPFLFCNKYGEGYFNEETGKDAGWKSMWQRFEAKVMATTKVKEHFTDHDLRAKAASDVATIQEASVLLSHKGVGRATAGYRRKPDQVPTGRRGTA